MEILATILILIIYIRAISYGIYEIKNNKNKSGGTTVIVVSSLICIFTIGVIYLYH